MPGPVLQPGLQRVQADMPLLRKILGTGPDWLIKIATMPYLARAPQRPAYDRVGLIFPFLLHRHRRTAGQHPDQGMNMIGHDAPLIKEIAMSVAAQQTPAYCIRKERIPEQTLPAPRIKTVIETVEAEGGGLQQCGTVKRRVSAPQPV